MLKRNCSRFVVCLTSILLVYGQMASQIIHSTPSIFSKTEFKNQKLLNHTTAVTEKEGIFFNNKIIDFSNTPQQGPRYGWIAQPIGIANNLHCVHFINENEGWIAADSLGILQTVNGGNAWDLFNLVGIEPDYNHVYFLNNQVGYISGKSTYFRTLDGSKTWLGAKDTNSAIVRLASFPVNNSVVWLVGGNESNCERRKFFKQNYGGTSSTLNILFPNACLTTLKDIYMTDINTGWAVGSPGEIWKTTNGSSSMPAPSWNMQVSHTTKSLNAIFMITNQVGWIVGDSGVILHTIDGGINWQPQTSGITINLHGVSFIDANNGISVGDSGTILKTLDGGKSWSKEISERTDKLNSVVFIHPTSAFAVGQNGAILKYSKLPPSVPLLLNPSNASSNQPLQVTLSWADANGAENYTLQVSLTNDFNNIVFSDSLLTSTNKLITGLLYDTTYYWRISATNEIGTSGWSDTWHFSTLPSLPEIPILMNPSNNAIDQPIGLNLIWNNVSNAETYSLQLSSSFDFSNLLLDETGLISTSKEIMGLTNNTAYYWRVNAANAGGTSDWSDVWKFSTIHVVGTKEINSRNRIYFFPNPTHGNIYVQGIEQEIENVSIFSLDNQLLVQYNQYGVNQIDLANLQAGVFIIKIITNKGMLVSKIIKY